MNTRDKILAAQDLPKEKVHIAAWGVDVYVHALTGEQYHAMHAACPDDAPLQGPYLAHTLHDAEGVRIFTDDDTAALMAKHSAALSKLYKVALRLNGDLETEAEKKSDSPATDTADS